MQVPTSNSHYLSARNNSKNSLAAAELGKFLLKNLLNFRFRNQTKHFYKMYHNVVAH